MVRYQLRRGMRYGRVMATRPQPADDVVVQLATRVPETLLQRVKVFCVRRDVTVMAFVAEALREKLRRAAR